MNEDGVAERDAAQGVPGGEDGAGEGGGLARGEEGWGLGEERGVRDDVVGQDAVEVGGEPAAVGLAAGDAGLVDCCDYGVAGGEGGDGGAGGEDGAEGVGAGDAAGDDGPGVVAVDDVGVAVVEGDGGYLDEDGVRGQRGREGFGEELEFGEGGV